MLVDAYLLIYARDAVRFLVRADAAKAREDGDERDARFETPCVSSWTPYHNF